MIVAITGGTGFIGRGLVLRHVAAGDTVRVLSRRPVKDIGFPDVVEVYSGGLLSDGDRMLLSRFLCGADVVYHCAGEISRPKHMRSVHVIGTGALVRAAFKKIGHWVQLSSVGAYGPYRDGVIDETTPLRPVGPYETTKVESDLLVQQAEQQGGFTCTVLRPSNVFGTGMRNQSLHQMTGMINRGLFSFIGRKNASANYIAVDNVVEALERCGRMNDARGKVYNLSDHRPMEEFVATIADALGKSRPGIRVPESAARLVAGTLGQLPRFPLTDSRVDALTTRVVYSSKRIERDIGYSHLVTMEDALARFVQRWKSSV